MPGGRPKDPHARRNAFCLRLSDAELGALERARRLDPADRRGKDFVDWVRTVVTAYAADRLGREVTRAGLRPRTKAAVVETRRRTGASDSAKRRTPASSSPRRPSSSGSRSVSLRGLLLEDFAARVKEALGVVPHTESSPTRRGARFGDDKVFIVALWHQLGGNKAMPLPEFKGRLVAAHVAKLLTLARADLVEAMHSRDVEESETAYLRGTFHFVRT